MTATAELQPLTERQREVLQYIASFIAERGYSPTTREVCVAFAFASPNGAVCHLDALRRKGWLSWEENRTRTMKITEGCDLGL